MSKSGNLERGSSQSLEKRSNSESRTKPLDNKHLLGSHRETQHHEKKVTEFEQQHDNHESKPKQQNEKKGIEFEQYHKNNEVNHDHDYENKETEYDQHPENNEIEYPSDANSRDSERREKRDFASLITPSEEDAGVSALLTTDHLVELESYDVSGSNTDYAQEAPGNEEHEASASNDSGTNPGESHTDGDGRSREGDLPPYETHDANPPRYEDYEADPPRYEDYEKDTLFEVQEGDHSSFDQWEKEEARRQTEWSEKATNAAKDKVHRQLGPDFAEHDIKFDTGVAEQSGQESSELPEFRAYKDNQGRIVISNDRLNGTLPENMEIDDTDAKSKLTRVPLEEADPLLKDASPEGFSGRSDLQAYRKKGEKEVVVTSPENEHKYKENGDYEHIGSVDLSGSREREAREEVVEQAGYHQDGSQEQYEKNGDYKQETGDEDNRYETRLDKSIRLLQEARGLVQDLGNLRGGKSSSDQKKPSKLKRIVKGANNALDRLEDSIVAGGTQAGNQDVGE